MGMTDRIWTAGLVVIGDEILSGRTHDKNIAQIATWLQVQGIRLALGRGRERERGVGFVDPDRHEQLEVGTDVEQGHRQLVAAREHAVVGLGFVGGSAGDGNDALTLLACALGDELLDPQAEPLERRRKHERQLVTPASRSCAHQRAQR